MIFIPIALPSVVRLEMGVDTYMYHKTTSGALLGLMDFPGEQKFLVKSIFYMLN